MWWCQGFHLYHSVKTCGGAKAFTSTTVKALAPPHDMWWCQGFHLTTCLKTCGGAKAFTTTWHCGSVKALAPPQAVVHLYHSLKTCGGAFTSTTVLTHVVVPRLSHMSTTVLGTTTDMWWCQGFHHSNTVVQVKALAPPQTCGGAKAFTSRCVKTCGGAKAFTTQCLRHVVVPRLSPLPQC